MQWLVVLAPGLTKMSVLLLYRRIFLGKVFRITTWILLVSSSVWTIGFFFGNICKFQIEIAQGLFNRPSSLHPDPRILGLAL